MAMLMGLGLPVQAQSPLEGPLAKPGAHLPPLSLPKAKRPVHKAHKDAHRDERARNEPGFDPNVPDHARVPDDPAHRSAVGDPVSFGMKWNGSNDSASQTRVQNYDGNAPGTGAEVGLKLHF
jgi:hypothetical protein